MEKFIITKGLTKDPKELLHAVGFLWWKPLTDECQPQDYPDAKKQPHVQVSASAKKTSQLPRYSHCLT